MDFDRIKRYLSLFLTALGVFVIIFLIYSIFLISRMAQKKEKHEIDKGYATEQITATPTPNVIK